MLTGLAKGVLKEVTELVSFMQIVVINQCIFYADCSHKSMHATPRTS